MIKQFSAELFTRIRRCSCLLGSTLAIIFAVVAECNAEPFENSVSSMRLERPGKKYGELLPEVYLFERLPFDLLPIIKPALLEFRQLKYKEVSNLSYETVALPIPLTNAMMWNLDLRRTHLDLVRYQT